MSTNGTLQGGVLFTSTNGGQLSLDGINDFISTDRQYNINEFASFSIGVWFNTTSTLGRKIIGTENVQIDNNGTGYDHMLYVGSNGKLHYANYSNRNEIVTSTNVVNDGYWNYAVGTFNSSTRVMKLYVNGEKLSQEQVTATDLFPGNVWWRIGSYKLNGWPNAGDGYFQGRIAAAHVYKKELSNVEVLENFNAKKSLYITAGTPSTTVSTNTNNSYVNVSITPNVDSGRSAVSYLIHRAESATTSTWVSVGTTTNTSFIDTNVAAGNTYYYRTKFIQSDGKTSLLGPVSNAVTIPQNSILNTRFSGITMIEVNDFGPPSKDYAFSGTDSQTGQVFSSTSPQIWGSQWSQPRIQLINSDPPVGTTDTAWTREFTPDGFRLTRNIPYVGVPQAVYRLNPNAAFANQSMVYVRGKIKLPNALANMTTEEGGLLLTSMKMNYNDEKIQMDISRGLVNGVYRWQVRLAQQRANEPVGITDMWANQMFVPYKNTVPVQSGFYQNPAPNSVDFYYSFGAFAPDPTGAAPDFNLWYMYEFAYRMQSPDGVVQGNGSKGWVWCATSVGTASEPPANGSGTQRFYLDGRNMRTEPNPGATIIFPLGHYSDIPQIQGQPITWRQVEVYDRWPSDASPHPEDAI